MRWLLLKDLQILRRSPLLVALLVLYPVVLSVLIGVALSRGPERPRVAVLNEIPPSEATIDLGGQQLDASRYTKQLLEHIDKVDVQSREEAVQKVRNGDVLAAVIIPPNALQRIETGLEPAQIEVFFNADDPVKANFVRDTIAAQVRAANLALTQKLTEVTSGYLRLLVRGGTLPFFGRDIQILGLAQAQQILKQARAELRPGSPAGPELDRIISFAQFALDNFDLSRGLLATLAEPIRVDAHNVKGATTTLSSFAIALSVTVSLMVVTLLLAAGTLALEREENAFRRLVRGLVSRTALLGEKVVLSGACAFLVAILMLAGLAAFVDLQWQRFPLWLPALVLGALAFAAMGVAIGALTREVRTASLLAFMIALPIAFLSLVPSGSVSSGVYGAARTISAAFPFRPTLEALQAGLNGSEMGLALVHLAILVAAFGLVARFALRRFG